MVGQMIRIREKTGGVHYVLVHEVNENGIRGHFLYCVDKRENRWKLLNDSPVTGFLFTYWNSITEIHFVV